jgi:hypothetical protein
MHVVEIGAHAYALRRSMRRTLVAKKASEVPVCLQLFDRLLSLLGRS